MDIQAKFELIKKEYKTTILRQLRKEQFDTTDDFVRWLDGKGLPHGHFGTIKRNYRDTVLLWLIKERFDTDTDFKHWLDENGIPNEFGSWV